MNNDEKLDLLVSLELQKEISGESTWYVEVRAYEIPYSEDFKLVFVMHYIPLFSFLS